MPRGAGRTAPGRYIGLKAGVCVWLTTVGARAPCSVWFADLCRGDEVSRWWWALAGRAGAAGDGANAGGAAVRRGRGAGAGGDPAAGEHEVGLSVAATLAGRRRGGAGLERTGRSGLPAVRRPAGPAAHRAGARAGRARLGRSAVDPGPNRHGDRPAVPPPVHPARHRVPAAPPGLVGAGAPAPRGRARRGRDRRVAHPDLGEGTRLAAATGAWIVFEDEAGATLRPPKARTWAARGHTPQIAVSGRGGRVSMAALVCYRPGHRSRLFYRLLVHRRRRGERRSFSEDDYAALIAAAHAQLQAPIILIWDNLNVHRSAAMRRFCDAHDWLTVVQLPAYAPELNATEGVWAQVKRDLGNLLAGTLDQLAATAKRLLKRIQYRPELIDGFRAQTGLALDPQPP